MRSRAGSTMGRLVSVCEQMGVSTTASMVGNTMGPPADRQYAVEPVGVETMSPSARYAVANWPATETSRLMMRLIADLVMTTSFSATYSLSRSPCRTIRAPSIIRSSTRSSSRSSASRAGKSSSAVSAVRKPSPPRFTPRMGTLRSPTSRAMESNVPSPPRTSRRSTWPGSSGLEATAAGVAGQDPRPT